MPRRAGQANRPEARYERVRSAHEALAAMATNCRDCGQDLSITPPDGLSRHIPGCSYGPAVQSVGSRRSVVDLAPEISHGDGRRRAS